MPLVAPVAYNLAGGGAAEALLRAALGLELGHFCVLEKNCGSKACPMALSRGPPPVQRRVIAMRPGESKARSSGRDLRQPAADQRSEHGILQCERADFRTDRAGRNEPAPDHDVAVGSKAQVDDADGGEQPRPGITGGDDNL